MKPMRAVWGIYDRNPQKRKEILTMPGMSYEEVVTRRDTWEINGNRLISREDVERFDEFIADEEEFAQYKGDGLRRALVGDFSQFETVEPMMKGYLGAKKCYDLYDRYHGNASDPKLREEIKNRLMEADLRTGFAYGGKDPQDPVSKFLKECERIANREMLIQTLEEPDPTAKLRLLDQFKRENPATAQQQLNATLSEDLEQRVEIAKILFMNHLGKFQTLDKQNKPMEMNENMAEIYTHGGRTMFILPAGGNQDRVMDSIEGQHADLSGLKSRNFATHATSPRKLNADGSIASEGKELKLSRGPSAYSPGHHRGMNASVGGLGQVGPNGKVITADGTHGHMYMHITKGKQNACGALLVGFENSGPGQKGRLGHTHDASAKKGGNSVFLSDKSYMGKETGGRVVDLSGLSADQLSSLLTNFENAYRNAAKAAHDGNPELLNACNNLLTGKVMSVGQVKGMLQSLNVPHDSIEAARAGHSAAPDYKPISAEDHPPVEMKIDPIVQKRPLRVTQCEGLVRPEPPAVMKKPGLLKKVLHYLSFASKNSYVNQYKAYQRALPGRIDAYKKSLDDYNSTLQSLERGENPKGLKAAYDRAVKQAETTFGVSAKQSVAASEPKQPVAPKNNAPKSASPQMKERLENTILDTLVKGAVPEVTESFKVEFRAQIRNTESYNRLINSGDENISKVLSNPVNTQNILANISKEILEHTNQAQHNQDAPNRNHEPQISQPEQAPRAIGGMGR